MKQDHNGDDCNLNLTWHDCPGKDSEQKPGKPGHVVSPDAPAACNQFDDNDHHVDAVDDDDYNVNARACCKPRCTGGL